MLIYGQCEGEYFCPDIEKILKRFSNNVEIFKAIIWKNY